MKNAVKLGLVAMIASLFTSGFSSVQAQHLLFDPALNVATVEVKAGATKEDTVHVPVGGFLRSDEGIDAMAFKGVEGPGGLSATLKSAKIITRNGERQFELKLIVKHEFLKGTSVGIFPIQLTLENTKSSGLCNFFITVNVK
jgi:hypothetical protein